MMKRCFPFRFLNDSFLIHTINFKPFLGSGKKPKVKARAAELNAEPELFQFIANNI